MEIIIITSVLFITYLAVRGYIRFKHKEIPYRTDYKPTYPKKLTIEQVELIEMINNSRTDKLEWDALLFRIAEEHCQEVIDGAKPHSNFPFRDKELRMNNFVKSGECVGVRFGTVGGFYNGYKRSAKHWKLLQGDYTHIGTSIINDVNVTIVGKYKKL